MTWFWSDDLARLLIEVDGIPVARVADWISGPTAHRADGEALDFARRLLGETLNADPATSTAA